MCGDPPLAFVGCPDLRLRERESFTLERLRSQRSWVLFLCRSSTFACFLFWFELSRQAHNERRVRVVCSSADPRFEGGGGSSKLNYDIFRKAYGFLGKYQDSEIEELKKSLKKEKNQVIYSIAPPWSNAPLGCPPTHMLRLQAQIG